MPTTLRTLCCTAAAALLAACGTGTASGTGGTTVSLELYGRDMEVTVRYGGHIPDEVYFIGGSLRGTDAVGAYVVAPSEAADLVGTIERGQLVDLDGDGDDDLVIERSIPGQELCALDVWLRNGRTLDRVLLEAVPEALLPEAQPGRATRETIVAKEGRLARRIRRGDAEVTLVVDLATGKWSRPPESDR